MKILAAIGRHAATLARFIKPSLVPAVIAGAVVMTGGYIVEQQQQQNFRSELSVNVHNELNLRATRLQGEINSNISIMRGFADAVSVQPDMSAALFNQMARKVLIQNPQIVRISAAPGSVITRTFPQQDNQPIIGTDFRRFGSSRAAVDQAQSKSRPVIAGPVRLPSGRTGFNLFSPVFARVGGTKVFWGFIEAIIDERQIYSDARLFEEDAADPNMIDGQRHIDMQMAMRDISVGNNIQDAFLGDNDLFEASPVIRRLQIPGGTWEMAGVPTGGWARTSPDIDRLRLIILFAASIIVIPIVLTAGLVNERQRNLVALRSRERELMTLAHRLDLALEASRIGIWEIDLDTQERYWGERMYQLHGLDSVTVKPSYAAWQSTVHPDDVASASDILLQALEEDHPYRSQYRVVLPDGQVHHIRNVGSTHVAADGRAKITGISWDVTDDVLMHEQLLSAKALAELKNAELEKALAGLSEREQQLEELSTRLDLALDSYHCGIWESNPETHMETWDMRMCQLHGLPFTDGKITSDQWIELIEPEDRWRAKASSFHFNDEFKQVPLVVRVPQPDGSVRHIRSVGQIYKGRDGTSKVIGIAFDVTEDAVLTQKLTMAKNEADAKNVELELANHRIEHNALHDPLTRLGNRRMLDSKLENLAQSRNSGVSNVALLHIDLDRFKQINDTLGHAAGDAMLVHAAQVLRSNVRDTDMVARIGGDEFVVVVTDFVARNDLVILAERIIAQMRQPVDYNGFPCRFGVSIGIALAGDLAVDERKLLVNADIALYRAKENGRNRHEFFTDVLQAEISTTKRIADEILEGIENDQFVAWYQPQFVAGTLKLAGVEALIRWNHPRDGILTPDKFLKIAEELNVVAILDRIVLERALIDGMRWAALGIDVPKISVNVSAKRLSDDSLLNSLKGLSFKPGQLSFELVESIFLDESDDIVTANIEGIKQLGIDIEIDDFGTGHTSIVSLLKIKPKRLKIDRQLVAPILHSRNEQALVRSIIEIGRSLGIETVAEGVETMQHAEMLALLGCDLLQGYAFARPLSTEKFVAFAKETTLRLAS